MKLLDNIGLYATIRPDKVIGLLPVKSYLPSPPTVLSPLRGRGFLL